MVTLYWGERYPINRRSNQRTFSATSLHQVDLSSFPMVFCRAFRRMVLSAVMKKPAIQAVKQTSKISECFQWFVGASASYGVSRSMLLVKAHHYFWRSKSNLYYYRLQKPGKPDASLGVVLQVGCLFLLLAFEMQKHKTNKVLVCYQ